LHPAAGFRHRICRSRGPVARQDRDVEGVTFVDVEGDSDIETG
jgi:hypothetical protein